MATQLTAPLMGEGVEELTLVKWLKQEGEQVEENESIVEVETDKVATELPSPASGVVLQRLAEEGQTVKVGDLLAWIGEAGEDVSVAQEKSARQPGALRHTNNTGGGAHGAENLLEEKSLAERVETSNPASSVSDSADITERIGKRDAFLSPLVKRMLAENHLDASQISGTGQDGRITKQDVLAYLDSEGKSGVNPATLRQAQGADKPLAELVEASGTAKAGLHPVSSIRRTIAQRMLESLNTSAHVLTVMEADLSRVEAHRKLNKPLFAQDGVRLTLTPYFVAAITAALKANPKVNSSWTDEGLLIHPDINIGMAVSLGDEGLIVPVIKNADTLSLLGIARQVNDLAERARGKKLKPEEVRGGTFSLTNHGMSGSLFASPIITQPQVGILGTGLVQKRAVVITDDQGNDSIAIRPMVYLSFVFDHRVLDGEGADNFLRKVKDTLENWR